MDLSEEEHRRAYGEDWGKDVPTKVQHVWIHDSYQAPEDKDPDIYMRADIVHGDENLAACENCGNEYLRDYIVTYVQGGPPLDRDGDVWVYECFSCFMEYFSSILSEQDYAAMRKEQQ